MILTNPKVAALRRARRTQDKVIILSAINAR
jgi:hypothetical protein